MSGTKKAEYRLRKKRGRFSIFILIFLVLVVMTTIQSLILGEYIDYTAISFSRVMFMHSYWVFAAAVFTLLINYYNKRYYEKPVKILADGTKKVAGGDFSVFLKPLHRPDRLDYVDVMFLDFNKMVEELGSIETLKTDFVSNVSHEMKIPISIIKNYAEMLQKETLSEEKHAEYAVTIEEAATRLSDLVSNILKLNKLENKRIAPEMEIYDVCRQLCECAIRFEDLWEEKGIDLEVDIEDRAMINADANLMELVWNNLLSNAIKFTDAGGTVTICQASTEDSITVSISDTGCGMNHESMNHIFDKFYQGDTSHSMEGNGLGLALVQRVLHLMDGDIHVFSQEGKGSTFTVTMPAAEGVDGMGERQNSDE